MKNKDKRIKIKGMSQILIDIKPNRCDSDVYINQKMDLTNLANYIENKKKDGYEISYFHAFAMAFAKTIYNRPKLNRYVKNHHVYEHNNVIISFVAKVSFDDKSEEIMIMIDVEKDDTLESISKKIKDKVNSVRNKKIKKELFIILIKMVLKFIMKT